MCQEQFQPVVKLFSGNGEAFTETFHGRKVQEIFRQDLQDEEKAMGSIRDDEVRKDGVCMAAGTDEAEDAEAVADRGAMDEIEKGAVIVGVDRTGAFCPAAGTSLEFRAESSHKGIKKVFGRSFYANKLAKQGVFSYHSKCSGAKAS